MTHRAASRARRIAALEKRMKIDERRRHRRIYVLDERFPFVPTDAAFAARQAVLLAQNACREHDVVLPFPGFSGADGAAGVRSQAEATGPGVPAAPVNPCTSTGDTGDTGRIATRDGNETLDLIHEFQELARRDRPQDPGRDGEGLRFRPLGSRKEGGLPPAIELRDARRRTCVYFPASDDRADANEPASPHGKSRRDGGFQFETLQHGGDLDDAMPLAIRITDGDGRSLLYEVPQIDGNVMLSKGFTLERPSGKPRYLGFSVMPWKTP